MVCRAGLAHNWGTMGCSGKGGIPRRIVRACFTSSRAGWPHAVQSASGAKKQQVEDFVRADDERRRRDEPVEPLQHDYPIDSESRQPPL